MVDVDLSFFILISAPKVLIVQFLRVDFRSFNDVHRYIQYKAQKQHRGDKTLSSEQLPEYGNSSVLFECLMVDVNGSYSTS